jgi:prepilin-type processing-associated H-X9-DG protein
MKTHHALGFAAAAWLAIASPALAEPTRDQVMDGAARCEGIPDNRLWLDCFYGSAQPMRALLGLTPAPEGQTRLVPAPGAAYGGSAAPVGRAPARPKSESFWSSVIGNTKPLADDMPMTAYGFGGDGRFTVTMADGHVWQQAEVDIRKAKWKKPAASYKVTINNSASANLYDLRVEGVVYKVTRVR